MSKIQTAKSVLITGCSAGGSGSALAENFQKRGLHVFATARTLSKMSHLRDLPNVTLLELDVTSPQSITIALDAVKAQTGGKLDYLVNNAGQSMVMPALDTDIDEAKKLFDVNFWGVIATTQAFAPLVIAAKGTIVNICSISGYVNAPWMSKLKSVQHPCCIL
jgi:1-acylglycerone phosphate reductase